LMLVFIVPPFAGPDEQCHYDYVRYLVQHRTLPVDVHQDSHYEYFQAPLYYLALSPFYALSNRFSDHSRLYLLRFINLLMAAAILWLGYRILVKTFPPLSSLIAGSLAFASWHPAYARNSVCLNNDNLAALICVIVICLLACREKASRPFGWHFSLGLIWGLGVLAKTSLLALAPLVLYATWAKAEAGPYKSRFLNAGTLFLSASLAALLTCGFWLIRNQALYGNMMGMGPYWPRPQAPFSPAFQLASLKHTWVSFWRSFEGGAEETVWGVFKYLWLALTAGAWAGWLVKLLGRGKSSCRDFPYGLKLLIVAFASFYAAGWMFGVKYGKGFHGFFDGRFLFAVMIPAGTLFAFGLEQMASGKWEKHLWNAWGALLLVDQVLLGLILLKII
jgi:hypothetical protein